MTVADASNSDCKKAVAALENRMALLEKRVTKLEEKLADRTNALLVGFLGLVAFLLYDFHFLIPALCFGFLGLGVFLLYVIRLLISSKQESV
jgi:hypothetical protein